MNTTHTPKKPPANAETRSAGQGMPTRLAQPDEASVGRVATAHDASVEASLALPHERDQALDMTPDKPSPLVKQAGKDLARGLQDTSKGAEMDKAYQKLRS